MSQAEIVIRGARVHNLKNIDVKIPRDKFVVITGLSGSGKSSLVFDTVYAEGQRRYLESLPAYAAQFLGQLDKPDVDFIEGLSPAISIDQKSISKNPRSTVGTITEIYDYLRLLFARAGTVYCPTHGLPIAAKSTKQIVQEIMRLKAGQRFYLLAPLVKNRKGSHDNLQKAMLKEGYTRLMIDEELHDISEKSLELDPRKKHTVSVVIDRLVLKADLEERLTDSLETALRVGKGVTEVKIEGGETLLFNQNLSCTECGFAIEKLMPQIFSFNSPLGACSKCSGLGYYRQLDPDLIVTRPDLALEEGAINLPLLFGEHTYMQVFMAICRHFKIDMSIPYEDLDERSKKIIMYGGEGTFTLDYADDAGALQQIEVGFPGLVEVMNQKYQQSNVERVRQQIEHYMGRKCCTLCQGARLLQSSLAVLVGGKNINEVVHLSITELQDFLQELKLGQTEQRIALQILKGLRERVKFLIDVGLEYLTLNRSVGTLSGGEAQRIRLAKQIGLSLTGVLYVLDEPSIGLHQRDNGRLLRSLKQIRDLGNTLLVVEHDEETILAADYVLDVGPGAGVHGGEITAQGTPEELIAHGNSLTSLYLKGEKKIEVPLERRLPSERWLKVLGATEHNLQSLNVAFPVGLFTCVTGVSGSGKSTLVNEILLKALERKLHFSRAKPGAYEYIEGIEHFDKVISVDQAPIGRNPRSNPITYIGAFDEVRELFARTPEARARGYTKRRFSFNVKGGRCENCGGYGTLKIEMHFLSDVYVRCTECDGERYNNETLLIKYKGMSISDVLEMTVYEGRKFFKHIPGIERRLATLCDVGLGYLKLGQSSTTLSGGEAQRVKLASELHRRTTGRTLYILDEPTTGLHIDDVARLLHILQCFVESGNTVIVIEHNLDVLKSADYIIDLGPEGGDGGGQVVAEGSPEAVAKITSSHTGRYLAKTLQKAKLNEEVTLLG
ncbi:MAG: excinuclease subunit UvrA [Bacillota bacterium]|jgi:excinuclease ABC subunit A